MASFRRKGVGRALLVSWGGEPSSAYNMESATAIEPYEPGVLAASRFPKKYSGKRMTPETAPQMMPTSAALSAQNSNSVCNLCGRAVGIFETTTQCGHRFHSSCWQQYVAKHANLQKKSMVCPVCNKTLRIRLSNNPPASPHLNVSQLNSISSLDNHSNDGLYPKCYQITDGTTQYDLGEDDNDTSVDTSTSSCSEDQFQMKCLLFCYEVSCSPHFRSQSYIASPNLKSDGICAEIGFLDNSIFTPFKQKRFIEIKSPPSACCDRKVLNAYNSQKTLRFPNNDTKQENYGLAYGRSSLTKAHGTHIKSNGNDENNNPSVILFM
eukprot:750691-Hanusia_phi.AAC.3